ncbi:hypothetical protein [Nocardioides sp. KR10-350]|uniref:hypothetical protein n=1 Tax=Nocardioides cheoyonin TaxID=3156615 RepID=UPI0032B4B061
MLTRDQQQLLAAAGHGLAASALLDDLRASTTFEGGSSAPQDHCWISYNRKAIWLEDHTSLVAAMASAGVDSDAWRRIRPTILVKVTWAEAAAHGASLPASLREELDTLRRTERTEQRRWREFSDARGGWPWRRRFTSDEEHQAAQAEWDQTYGKHLAALRDVWDRRKVAIARALPLTVDDEPVDLLELLDQQTAPDPSQAGRSGLQAAALRAAPQAQRQPHDEGRSPVPLTVDQGVRR